MAKDYGRYGYRRIMALLREEGWQINHKRMLRLWRREGLKVPAKQPKRKRLWFNDGSCVRQRPEYKDHVWSYDFVTLMEQYGIDSLPNATTPYSGSESNGELVESQDKVDLFKLL